MKVEMSDKDWLAVITLLILLTKNQELLRFLVSILH